MMLSGNDIFENFEYTIKHNGIASRVSPLCNTFNRQTCNFEIFIELVYHEWVVALITE